MATIIETAKQAGTFGTLIKAVQAAGLTQTLEGAGPFTVFAPTDAAFAKLPPGTVETLLFNPVLLAQILTYHVVPGRYRAADVAGLPIALTVQGTPLTLDSSSGVKVNNATVTQADIEADNGVIHVIDQVLLPLPGRQVAQQGAQWARQAIDASFALNPFATTTRQFFSLWAAQTEAAAQATFSFQNSAIDAGLAAWERSGGDRAYFQLWVDFTREAQQTTLDVWRTVTR
jgi:hypothetical protein